MLHTFTNLPLSRLTPSELEALVPHLVRVELRKGETVGSERESESLYFVEAGIICVVASLGTRENIALALTGCEGVGNALAILGPATSPSRLVAPFAASAFRTEAALFRQHPRSFRHARELVERYTQAIVAQYIQSAVCNRYHTGRERLASWLLLAADRCGTPRLTLTHEVLAEMVGGPRSLVTTALMALREAGAVDYRRSVIAVKREVLVEQACECYGKVTMAIDAVSGS